MITEKYNKTKCTTFLLIEAGNIMLYGNNCLVVFYKFFDTSYSYTKIDHIENLSDIGNGNIIIKFK